MTAARATYEGHEPQAEVLRLILGRAVRIESSVCVQGRISRGMNAAKGASPPRLEVMRNVH